MIIIGADSARRSWVWRWTENTPKHVSEYNGTDISVRHGTDTVFDIWTAINLV